MINSENNSTKKHDSLTPVCLVPDVKQSHAEYAHSLHKLCLDAMEKYRGIIANVSDGGASKKGLKAAERIRQKYGARLDELCAADFMVYSDDELGDCYSEISSVITALREAGDIIGKQ